MMPRWPNWTTLPSGGKWTTITPEQFVTGEPFRKTRRERFAILCRDCWFSLWVRWNTWLHFASKLQRAVFIDANWTTAYLVTREFGGTEEGGWWYDAHWTLPHRFTSLPCLHIRCLFWLECRWLEKRFASYREGDIYSVNGGSDIWTVAETDRWEACTEGRSKPVYE